MMLCFLITIFNQHVGVGGRHSYWMKKIWTLNFFVEVFWAAHQWLDKALVNNAMLAPSHWYTFEHVILINRNQTTFHKLFIIKFLQFIRRSKGFLLFFFYKGNWRWPARSDELAHDIQSTVANTTICLFLVKMVSLVNLMLQGNIAWMLPRKQ